MTPLKVITNFSLYRIANDSDFREMLREQLGDEAAQWYEERMERVDELLEWIHELANGTKFFPKRPAWAKSDYDFAKVEKLPHDSLTEIAATALEIPRWDE